MLPIVVSSLPVPDAVPGVHVPLFAQRRRVPSVLPTARGHRHRHDPLSIEPGRRQPPGRKLVLLNPGVQLAVITASTGIDGAALRQRRRMICPTGRHQHCVAVKQRPICKPRRRPQAARTPHNRTRVGCQRLSQSPLGGAATCRTGAGSPATHVLAAHCFWNLDRS